MVRRVTLQRGFNPLVQARDMQYIELGIFKGTADDTYTLQTEDCEATVVVLSGRCHLHVNGQLHPNIGGRRSVFDGNAWSLYAPNNTEIRIHATEDTEVAIAKTRVPADGPVRIIKPEDVVIRDVGVWNWRRDVKDIIDKRTPAARLLVGETINPPGNWSSWPPHKHDAENPPYECKMEEVYFFKVQPADSFGLVRLFTAEGDIDEVSLIYDNSVLLIPRGYHPIAAAPGTRVYYLWVLAGERRELLPNDAPEYRWMKDTEAIVREMKRGSL